MAALAAALVVTSAGVRAQESDVAAGHAFARNACQPCHDVANTSGMTATAIRVFLMTSHPQMPNLILTPEETEDVIAYILSLRVPG
jgi:cytochrome c